jgi:hypothetical protein
VIGAKRSLGGCGSFARAPFVLAYAKLKGRQHDTVVFELLPGELH